MRRGRSPDACEPPRSIPTSFRASWLRASFPEDALERAFRVSRDERSLSELRLIFSGGMLTVLVALAVEVGAAGGVSVDQGLLVAVVASGLLGAFLTPQRDKPQQLAGAWCLLAAMVLLATATTREAASPLGYDAIGGVVMGLIAVVAGSLLVSRALLICALLVSASVLTSAAVDRPIISSHALAGLSVLALAASWWRERLLRRAFLLRHELERERALSDTLLFNVMPERIARRIRTGEFPIADNLGEATVLFLDLVGFTSFAAQTEPDALVELLNELWTSFDDIVEEQGLEKLKTIGDAYMAVVGGARSPRLDAEMAAGAVSAGLRMISKVREVAARHGYALDARVGIHTGPVVAGVIGRYRYQFDVWGDTVNVANRLEEGGVAGRVHLSAETFRRIRHRFEVERHGAIEVEGKGRIETFLVLRTKTPSLHR